MFGWRHKIVPPVGVPAGGVWPSSIAAPKPGGLRVIARFVRQSDRDIFRRVCHADNAMINAFQIIFTPLSAAELARMPKELQLQILGDFRGLPQQVRGTELDEFGKLEMDGRILHRFRVGDYRVYFERHDLGVLVHRILSRHTLKDFLFRSGLKTGEDEALQENPKFWELIEAAKTSARAY